MNQLDNKLMNFRRFIEDEANTKSLNNLYIMTSVINTYYEFIAQAYNENLNTRNNHKNNLDTILKDGRITQSQFDVMNETRIVRNKILHNLSYLVTAQDVIEFHNNCLPNKNPQFLAPEQVENSLLNAIINGYCIIDNQLYSDLWRQLGRP
ncbi:hypothetical protein [Flavisericum labens]|uniref:hypothetical protein n=1 Tax=Flavisericum labens TaxID=3377112 RepID=UPI00387B5E72